jgi:hypothetical protein
MEAGISSVSAITAERSSSASPTPVARLVAPGPKVPKHTPGAGPEPPANVGHHAGRPFMCGQDKFDPVRLTHSFHVVDPAAARDAEHIFDAKLAKSPHDFCGYGSLVFGMKTPGLQCGWDYHYPTFETAQ